MANFMLSVMGSFAEFARALIKERQREGIALAKARRAYRGRNARRSSVKNDLRSCGNELLMARRNRN